MFRKILILLIVTSVLIFAKKNPLYSLKIDRSEIFNYDYSIVNCTGHCSFVNRSTKALNIILNFKKAMLDTNIMLMRSMVWRNNVWVKFSPLEFSITLKDFFKYDWFDIKGIRESCKPPMTYPWQKTTYKLLNYIPNMKHYPSFMPTGSYRVDVEFWDSNKKLNKFLEHHLYMFIDEIIKH
ncbi:PREDICTED: uncharacterized protein LOC108563528 [Nicrophorus vespilloides]|uniref:Uncharacterized protein LOC108563528 n=1 Tax=Nicrophorus vespilloides TaxID=110193 RepID=A0ABM1MT17_NICVS|nr:PREDICTED: uncharacterized protein LOC108563528 [Nicrophorus vespilloides]